MTDTERLDWLEQQTHGGACPGLVYDDNGHWAVAFDGVQNVVTGPPQDVSTAFFVQASQWRTTIREAIDAAHSQSQREGLRV